MDNDKSSVKHINGLLNASNTRLEGLRSLDAHLTVCSDEDFVEYCVNWMQNCCKTTASSGEISFTIGILNKLFKISSHYPELNKTVSFFITNRFFDHFFKYFADSNAGWNCAKTCFLFYKGPCGPFQEKLEKYLFKSISENKKCSPCVSDCFALLPCLGGGGNEGVNYKTNWKNQFFKFINISHSILNDMFHGIEELQQYDTKEQTYIRLAKKECTKNYLVVQLNNHCSILKSMLVNSYPAPKCIPTGLLLDLICRGLALNPRALRKSKIQTLYSVGSVLPQIQIILLDLLDSLIVTCKSQLLPNTFVICKLIQQTLDYSQSSCMYGTEKEFALLRISAYNTLCNWLVATKSGGCIDAIAKSVISHVLSDIELKKAVVLLKETKLKQNNIANTKQQSNRNIDSSANAYLCYAALQALQNLLKFSGVLLESDDQKYLQETVVKLIVNIHNSFPTEVLIPYSMPICRKGLYSILLELVNQPCPEWPPPIHFALGLFKKGQDDSSQEVSEFCSSALNALQVIIHQQFSNGPLLTTEALVNPDKNFTKKTKSTNVQKEVIQEIMNESMSESEELDNNLDFTNEKENENDDTQLQSLEIDNGLAYLPETLEKSSSNEENKNDGKSDDESSKESFCIENMEWSENMPLNELNNFSEEENQNSDEEIKSKKQKKSEEENQNSDEELKSKKQKKSEEENQNSDEELKSKKQKKSEGENQNSDAELKSKKQKKSEEENQNSDEEPKSKKQKKSNEVNFNSSVSSKCSTPELKEPEQDDIVFLENEKTVEDVKDINNTREQTISNSTTESASNKVIADNVADNSKNTCSNSNDDNSSSNNNNNNNNNISNNNNNNKETLSSNSSSETISSNNVNDMMGNESSAPIVETPKKLNNNNSKDIEVILDSNKEKSKTPEITKEEKSQEIKKHYFLRSKNCKSSSEEPEEILKKSHGSDSVKQTPARGMGKTTPAGSLSVSRRPRTRAVSKLRLSENENENGNVNENENENENELNSQKKNDAAEDDQDALDDESAFMRGFDDTISD